MSTPRYAPCPRRQIQINGGDRHLAATRGTVKAVRQFGKTKGASVKTKMQQHSDPHRIAPLIMVVDDEVLIRLIAVDMLHEAGFRVVEACNADEAAATNAASGLTYAARLSGFTFKVTTTPVSAQSYSIEPLRCPVTLRSTSLLP